MENNKLILVGLLTFLGGSILGYFVGRKTSKDYYQQLADEEIESVKEYYEKTRTENPERSGKYPLKKDEKPEESEFRTNNSPLVRSSLENNPNERAKRNYRLYSTGKNENKTDNLITNVFDISEEIQAAEDDDDDVTGEEMKISSETTPYVITDEEYNNEHDDYDKISLYYYMLDDTLCEENEEIVDDVENTIGYDSLNLLATQTTTWVRNERLKADYEIIGLNQSYAKTVAGFTEKNLTPREQYEQRLKADYEQRNKTRREADD
jgi:hypothetical protein